MTTIGWTHIRFPDRRSFLGESWNPISGCTKVSRGCDHCYAEIIAERFRGNAGYYQHGFDVTLRPEKIFLPLRWEKPRGIFVNSMSDLFHEKIPDDYILDVFQVMMLGNWHIYQILTKRAPRMLKMATQILDIAERRTGKRKIPSHIWFGVSVESRANIGRIHKLQDMPVPIRFISYEPALTDLGDVDLNGIDWLIFGGESGLAPTIRPIEYEWIDSIKERCSRFGTAFFVKQMGTLWAKEHYTDPTAFRADFKGEDMTEWKPEYRIQQYPDPSRVITALHRPKHPIVPPRLIYQPGQGVQQEEEEGETGALAAG